MTNKYFVLSGCLIILLFASCASLKTDTASHILTHREKVSAVSFCTAENKLAAITRDGIITIWDLNTGTKVREINTNLVDAVSSMIYTNFGNIIVRYKKDRRRITVYDANDFIQPIILGPYNDIEHVACTPDGRSIILSTVVISGNTNSRDNRDNRDIHGAGTTTETSRTSYSRQLIARNMVPDSMNFVITLPRSTETTVERTTTYRYSTERNIRRDRYGLNNQVTSISVDQTNNRVACGFSDKNIRIYYNIRTRTDGTYQWQTRSFSAGGYISDLHFSPDGNFLLSCGDRLVSLWNCETWSKTGDIKLSDPRSLEYSTDGSRFIVKDTANTFIAFDSRSARELTRFNGGNLIQSVSFNSSNGIIAIGRKDKSVIIWDIMP
jgi:hypothetical protein